MGEGGYQLRSRTDPDIARNPYPILRSRIDLELAARRATGGCDRPGPDERGRQMDLVVIDESGRKVRSPRALPVSAAGDECPCRWATGGSSLYRAIVVPAGEPVDPAVNDLNRKLTNVDRTSSPRPQVPSLYVAPTDMWWAYSTNGGHDYHGWRTGYDGSVGYAPTVMSSRQRRLNNLLQPLRERTNDIHHLRFLDRSRRMVQIDYATQYDVARGRVRLDNYRLVLIGNHCEFTTQESYRRFAEYLGRGGVVIHGGDSFAVRGRLATYLFEAADISGSAATYWIHLERPARRLSRRGPAAARTPAGRADSQSDPGRCDRLPERVSHQRGLLDSRKQGRDGRHHAPIRAAWISSPATKCPGPWGGEVDIAYEPQAWDILIRSDRAAPEEREFGVDAIDPLLSTAWAWRCTRISGWPWSAGRIPEHPGSAGAHALSRVYRRTVHTCSMAPRSPRAIRTWFRRTSGTRTRSIGIGRCVSARFGTRYPSLLTSKIRTGIASPLPMPTTWSRDRPTENTGRSSRTGSTDPGAGLNQLFAPRELRHLRFTGTFSNGQVFGVSNVQAFAD